MNIRKVYYKIRIPLKKINWDKRFADFSQPLEIEVGSGKGRFITTLAAQHPERNFVAIELQTTAAGIILRTKLEKHLDNLQILRGDAADINRFFLHLIVPILFI